MEKKLKFREHFRRNVSLLSCGAALLLFPLSGCISDRDRDTKDTVLSPDEIAKHEKEIGESMLQAYVKGDCEKCLRYLSEEVREKWDKREFDLTRDQIIKAMGDFKKTEFLTTLEAPGFRTHIWKVTFERKATLDQTKTLIQQTLFRVATITPENGKSEPFVISFGFN